MARDMNVSSDGGNIAAVLYLIAVRHKTTERTMKSNATREACGHGSNTLGCFG